MVCSIYFCCFIFIFSKSFSYFSISVDLLLVLRPCIFPCWTLLLRSGLQTPLSSYYIICNRASFAILILSFLFYSVCMICLSSIDWFLGEDRYLEAISSTFFGRISSIVRPVLFKAYSERGVSLNVDPVVPYCGKFSNVNISIKIYRTPIWMNSFAIN